MNAMPDGSFFCLISPRKNWQLAARLGIISPCPGQPRGSRPWKYGRWVIFVLLFSRGTAVTHPNAADNQGAQVTTDTTHSAATAPEERPLTTPPDAGTPTGLPRGE